MKTTNHNTTSNTEMVTISRAEYEAMQAKLEAKCAELADAMQKNQWLLEQLHLNKKKLFGTSSEQLDHHHLIQLLRGSAITKTLSLKNCINRRIGRVIEIFVVVRIVVTRWIR